MHDACMMFCIGLTSKHIVLFNGKSYLTITQCYLWLHRPGHSTWAFVVTFPHLLAHLIAIDRAISWLPLHRDEQTALAPSNCWPLTATLAPIIGTERAVMTENHPNNAIGAFTIPLLEPHGVATRFSRERRRLLGFDSKRWPWTINHNTILTWLLMKSNKQFYLVDGMGWGGENKTKPWGHLFHVSWFKHCHRMASHGSLWYVKGLCQK